VTDYTTAFDQEEKRSFRNDGKEERGLKAIGGNRPAAAT